MADVSTGLVAALWSVPQILISQHMAAAPAGTYALKVNGTVFELHYIALYLHIAAWIAQFYGHGVHEGRAPALMTNLFYSLLAPFFVTFEFMNGVFGYKEKEMIDIRKRINKDIAEFKKKKKSA